MTKTYEIHIPFLIREGTGKSDDDFDGFEKAGVSIGFHADSADDAINQLARLLISGDAEQREDG